MRRGWAKRPRWGEGLGTNTINEFKGQLKSWFDIGSAEPARKISAARMHRMLEGMHPTRYDLTTENQIKRYITKLSGEEKTKRKEDAQRRMEQASNVKNEDGKALKSGSNMDKKDPKIVTNDGADVDGHSIDLEYGKNDSEKV